MIRDGGVLDNVRILAPRTVALMTSNQSGTLHSTTGLGFGLGFQTVDRYGASGMAGSALSVGAEPTEQPTKSMSRAAPFWC
jgi:hypothetical protein